MAELIFSSDTLNHGRIKINQSYSGQTNIWSASTGTGSIIANNGTGNLASGQFSFAGGQSNLSSNYSSFVGGGVSNTASNQGASVVGGAGNVASGDRSFVGGGNANYSIGGTSFVGGGLFNSSNGESTVIGGGISNKAYGSGFFGGKSFVGGGANNTAFDNFSFVGGGYYNTAYAVYTTIGGGKNNTSLGNTSFIGGGNNNTSTGFNSVIGGGSYNSAIGDGSFIGSGDNNKTSQACAIVGGTYNNCYGSASFVGGGLFNTANGNNVVIGGGLNNVATGNYSFIGGGKYNTSNATYSSTLGGRGNNAGHTHSIALGGGSMTRANFDLVLGATDTDTPSTTNNTIRLQGTGGNIRIDGAVSTPEADYAEYFEWNDGNTNNEDRKGYFVSLINDKIQIGNTNVIGIISSVPAIIGDSASNKWNELYLKNEWGEIVKDEFNLFSKSNKKIYKKNSTYYSEYPNPSNKEGIIFTGDTSELINLNKKESYPKINPEYDPTEEYIPRENRKEWSPVGLLGKLRVRTAEEITGTKVDVNSNGMAINGNKYHVLKTIRPFAGNDYGIVQILFK